MYIYLKNNEELQTLISEGEEVEDGFFVEKDGFTMSFYSGTYQYLKTGDAPARAIKENKLIEKFFLLAENVVSNKGKKVPCGFYEEENLSAIIESGKEEKQRIAIRCSNFADLEKMEDFRIKILGNTIQPKIAFNGKKNRIKKWLHLQ